MITDELIERLADAVAPPENINDAEFKQAIWRLGYTTAEFYEDVRVGKIPHYSEHDHEAGTQDIRHGSRFQWMAFCMAFATMPQDDVELALERTQLDREDVVRVMKFIFGEDAV